MVEESVKITPKITFADSPPPAIGWIHGLPITISQQASDLLAAYQMGAQTVLSTLAPQSYRQPASPEQATVFEAEDDDTPYGEVTLTDLMSMDPLRREALMNAYGLQPKTAEKAPYDPTADTVKEVLREAGIPTEPEPGGARAGNLEIDEE